MQVTRAKLKSKNPIKQDDLNLILLGDWSEARNEPGKRSKNIDSFLFGRKVESSDGLLLDINISRQHAIVKFNVDSKKWTVTDLNSSNGVQVNECRISSGRPVALNNGDVVQIGPGADYVWIFEDFDDEAVFKTPNATLKDISSKNYSKHLAEEKLQQANLKILQERALLEDRVREGQMLQEKLQNEKQALERELESKMEAFEIQQREERENFEKSLSANQEENKIIRLEFEEKLERERAEILRKSKELEKEMKEKIAIEELKMSNLLLERDAMIETLRIEKEKAEKKFEEERKMFDEKISALQEGFQNTEKEKSEVYKSEVERLNREFEERLIQRQEEMEDAISREKAEKEAEKAEKEQIKQELESYKAEVLKLREETSGKRKMPQDSISSSQSKKQKEESEIKLLAKCHEELKCTVCDELFISPMTLNCGHVYCRFCIEQWQYKCTGSNFTCPNCRTKVENFSRSLHLENLIESLYKDVSDDLRAERLKLVEERKAGMKRGNNDRQKDQPSTSRDRQTISTNHSAASTGNNPPLNPESTLGAVGLQPGRHVSGVRATESQPVRSVVGGAGIQPALQVSVNGVQPVRQVSVNGVQPVRQVSANGVQLVRPVSHVNTTTTQRACPQAVRPAIGQNVGRPVLPIPSASMLPFPVARINNPTGQPRIVRVAAAGTSQIYRMATATQPTSAVRIFANVSHGGDGQIRCTIRNSTGQLLSQHVLSRVAHLVMRHYERNFVNIRREEQAPMDISFDVGNDFLSTD